jgi:hypothetical protein
VIRAAAGGAALTWIYSALRHFALPKIQDE